MVSKIISGGQTGADQGGLVAARQLGIPTGGWIPKGFLTESGPRPDLGLLYGLKEHKSNRYPPRTKENVKDSDGTAWFGRLNSKGYHCTFNATDEFMKPRRVITTPEGLLEFIDEFNIGILNVAGNRESSNPGIHRFTAELIIAALSIKEIK